jgi:hypothetical protein
MTEDDSDWLERLCKKRYGLGYDSYSSLAWFKNNVLKNPMMFYAVRSEDAFIITMLSGIPWLAGHLEANVVFICADDGCMWQAMRLLRCSVDWAKRRKCTVWRLSSDTDYDLAPLARRLGVTELSPRFILRL